MEIRWKNTTAGYGWLSISFHWLMLLLIVTAYVTMNIKSIFPKGSSSREAMVLLHYTLGLSVFCLVWPRLWSRSVGISPVIEPALPALSALLAKIAHFALYGLMIGCPLLGWLMLNAKGKPVPFFGAELPMLIDKNQEMAKLFKDVHKTIATTGYFLIGLHATTALYHHYVKRDNTLKLILPGS
jgi:cytochrome b561